MKWWLNPKNWLGENWKNESGRRIEALEASVQEAHLRVNALDNRINKMWATIDEPELNSDFD
jgi:hypothetical protein